MKITSICYSQSKHSLLVDKILITILNIDDLISHHIIMVLEKTDNYYNLYLIQHGMKI